ncbi:MAG: hypothetical protein WCS73_08290 [Lentisphaeria bacterium]
MPKLAVHSSKYLLFFLFLVAVLLYLPILNLPDLRSTDEALWGNLANSLINSKNYFTPELTADQQNCFPLYAWLVAICSFFHHPTTFTVRLPAVLSIFGIAILCGITAQRLKDNLAGFVAAAAVLTTFACLKIGVIGQAETVHAFFLSAAWIYWHRYGCQKEKWTKAWAIALSFVFLSVLTVGIKGLLLFYFPLLLTRHPGKNLRNLQTSTHFIFLTIFFIALIAWSKFTTFPTMLGNFSTIYQGAPTNFFSHLVLFPSKLLVYLLPWSLFLWAPFCLALRQFEPTGSACGYYRAILCCPLFLFWIIPGCSPLLLFACLGPAAILISIHYEIVIRRYGHIFTFLLEIIAWPVFLGLILLSIFWIRVANGGILIQPTLSPSQLALAVPITLALLLLITACLVQHDILRKKGPRHILSMIIILIFAARFLFVASFSILDYWLIPDHHLKSLTLLNQAPKNTFEPIYTAVFGTEPPPEKDYNKQADKGNLFYVVSSKSYPIEEFYTKKQWKYIQNPNEELPQKDPVVYMISARIPAVPNRNWYPVGPTIDMASERNTSFEFSGNIFQFRGLLTRKKDTSKTQSPQHQNFLRLYCGELKPEESFTPQTPQDTQNDK